MRAFAVVGPLLALAACQPARSVRPVGQFGPHLISAPAAVLAAADAAPRGYPGRFGLIVRRADQVGPRFFLNSEPDYRDQRNLSIAIEPAAVTPLRRIHGPDLRAALLGRTIEVDGVARRQRIEFTINGRRTGKYYYQTHVTVSRPDQISIRP